MTRNVAGSTPGLALSGSLTTLGKLFTHIYAFVTTEYNSVPDKGLASHCHRLQWSVNLRAHGLRLQGDQHLKTFLDSVTSFHHTYSLLTTSRGSVAEWLACWTQAQKVPGSNRSRDAVG